MRDYHRLDVWVEAHALVLLVYEHTREFPRHEMFGLTEQMRDCARSVPANIAEGSGRSSRKDLARFLDIAAGSASELAYYFELSRDLGYLSVEEATRLEERVDRVMRMLGGLSRTVRKNP